MAHEMYSWKEKNIAYKQRTAPYNVRARYEQEKQEYADREFERAYDKAKKMTVKQLNEYLKKDK